MTLQDIVEKIQIIRENYINDNITGDDTMEYLEDLCNDIKGSFDGFELIDNDSYYEEVDYSNLRIAD